MIGGFILVLFRLGVAKSLYQWIKNSLCVQLVFATRRTGWEYRAAFTSSMVEKSKHPLLSKQSKNHQSLDYRSSLPQIPTSSCFHCPTPDGSIARGLYQQIEDAAVRWPGAKNRSWMNPMEGFTCVHWCLRLFFDSAITRSWFQIIF